VSSTDHTDNSGRVRVGDPTTAGGDATDPAAGAAAVGAEVPFAALSLEARVDRTARLARIEATDLGRWRDGRNLQPQWDARAAHAARHVPPGAHVLDLGAGAQALRDLLPAGCRYTPSDLVARTPDTLIADLNRGQFPPGRWDVVTALGVLEYIHRLDLRLARMREAAPRAIVTYSAVVGGEPADRLKHGWKNSCTLPALLDLVAAAGWTVVDQESLNAGAVFEQWLLVLDAAGPA
jgi:hypothetical protein